MSNICHGPTCTAAEVGRFMEGISQACGNEGTCQLQDFMTVFADVGNFTVGIVGALVFLMWVVSGMRYLGANFFPGGFDENIKKGKQGIVTATVGLLIVFGAYAAILTLRQVLTGSLTAGTPNFVLCTAAEDEGKACALNSTCHNFACVTGCDAAHPDGSFICVDRTDEIESQRITGSCEPNRCPGGADVQCCQVKKTTPATN